MAAAVMVPAFEIASKTARNGAVGIFFSASAASPAAEKQVTGHAGKPRGVDSDSLLVERCVSGDTAAWEDLVKLHTRRVYGLCYRFTGNDTEAQDLTQDVFLRIFRTVKSFRVEEGSFSTWTARVARNLLIDHYRRSRQDRATDSIEDQLPGVEQARATAPAPDALVRGREKSEIVQAALKKLSPDLRETVILRDLQDMEYREISQVLGIPEGTVKSRLNRGRTELARILRKQREAL